MPLRYLNLSEPAYVPTYNTIQPELLDRSHSAIQQQVEQFNKSRRDLLDVAADTFVSGLQGQRDREFALNQFAQSRDRINKIVEEQGARSAMPYLDEEVRRITSTLSPLQRAAEARKKALERLEKNDKTPAEVKQYFSNIAEDVGIYDEETGELTGTSTGFNAKDLEIAANWEDMTDAIQKYVSNLNASTEESYEFQVSPAETARYRRRLKSLGFDNISSGTVAFLMSHPKYREQLDLLGRIEFEKEQERSKKTGRIPNLSIDNKGRLKATVRTLVRDPQGNPIVEGEDEFGNPIYKTKESDQTFSSFAEYKATELGSTYSRQGFFELTYSNVTDLASERAKEKKENLIPRFEGRVGLPFENQDIQSFISSSMEEAETLNNYYSSLQDNVSVYIPHLFPDSDANYNVDEETGELSFTVDGTAYTLDDLLEKEIIDENNYYQLKDVEMAMQSTRNKARVFEQNFDQAKVAWLNELANLSGEDRDFILENVEISDTGGISIKNINRIPKNIDNWTGRLIDVVEKGVPHKGFTESSRKALEQFWNSNNEYVIVDLKLYKDLQQAITGKESTTDKQTVVLRKVNGTIGIYQLKENIAKDVKEAGKRAFQQLVGSGRYDTAAMLLNPENDIDKQIIETIKRNQSIGTVMGQGNLLDSKGNTISFKYDEGMRLNAETIFIGPGGRATIGGTMYNINDKLENSQSVFWQGEAVESMLRHALGEDWEEVIADLSFTNMMPVVYDKGEVTFSSSDLVSIGAFRNVDGQIKTLGNVTVELRKNRDINTNSPLTTYIINIPGKEKPLIATNLKAVRRLIQIETAKAFK